MNPLKGRHMKAVKHSVFAALLLFGVSGCAIHHEIANDYAQYLANNIGASNLPKTDRASEYSLTRNTQEHSYEFRAVTTGYGNIWIVEFGKMLNDTLLSDDVQAAFGSLKKTENAAASDGLLVFDVQNYSFSDFSAHLKLNIALYRSNKLAFSKVYSEDGKSQGGKMFWGGAFAQRNAVQQSTKLAVDEILRELISDLNKTGKAPLSTKATASKSYLSAQELSKNWGCSLTLRTVEVTPEKEVYGAPCGDGNKIIVVCENDHCEIQ